MTPGGQKLGSASSAWQSMTPAQVGRPLLQQPAPARGSTVWHALSLRGFWQQCICAVS